MSTPHKSARPAVADEPAPSGSATPVLQPDEVPRQSRLLLIDGHSLAFRAFFALPHESFGTQSGQSTNAVYGFLSMLFNAIKGEDPTHVAVAFDLSGGTFRTRAYTEYKAGRDETPQPFVGQIELIQKVLDALGIRWLTYEDYEADDIVATLTSVAEAAGSEVLVSSGDRDALQLVTDSTTLLCPIKGVSEVSRMTPAAVAEKYGVAPTNYPDLAALVGESADNLPGVPGVGPKTAAKWIAQFGSLEAIVARADEIKGKAGESLRDNLDAVLRNRRLNAAVRDLVLPISFEELRLRPADGAVVGGVFAELEFGPTIRTRVPAILLADEPAAGATGAEQSAADVDESRVLGAGELRGWLDEHAAGGAAVSVAGSWALGNGDLTAIALAAPGAVAAVGASALGADDDAALGEWLADSSIEKAVHDGKLVRHVLGERGLGLAGIAMDVSLAEFLCRPDQRQTGLADLAERRIGRSLEAGNAKPQQELDLSADDDAELRLEMSRAAAIRDLTAALGPDLEEHSAALLMRDLELPLAGILAAMEAEGVAVDLDALNELEDRYGKAAEQAAEAAFDAIGGRQVNLGSPKQLQEVLFTDLEMPKTRKTKTGYTTDAEALAELYAKTEHPFLEHLLAHRDVTKLRQIVETLRKSVADDGRIHTTYSQTIAATGRLSSNNPNLQNIPARSAEGRRIRATFVRGRQFETLLTADYSQIEMRIMAHLSEDAGLIEAFRRGEDLHVYVASHVFGVSADEVGAEMRAKTKAVSYGLAYGLSAFGLSRQLGIDNDEAVRLRDDYFERFGGVRDYLRDVVERARETGYTETILGRRRYLPDLGSSNRQRRENAERVALNSPIQGSAADLIKLAMIGVDRALGKAGLESKMLLQVHDELVLDVAPDELETVREIVVTQMTSAYELSVPLDVSVGVGRSWFDAAH